MPPRLAALIEGEAFASYYGAPLVAGGEFKGVLEVFQRAPTAAPEQEWLDFLETLAGQAAVAIQSPELFAGLQRSHWELSRTYDETIEGWSRALDLRDKETEGHTLRVTDLTLQLAQAMGLQEDELVHIRRGALLHDIGKMGIPDDNLLKPEALSEEEREIMRKHPEHAKMLIEPIEFLAPALEIPYCHHEKWDGSGYPRGLKCAEIPTSARIFAVADVWDALSSDRPYRRAWPKEQVLEYIRSQSGAHFDPIVVSAFLDLLKAG